jgi:hypothetical protein
LLLDKTVVAFDAKSAPVIQAKFAIEVAKQLIKVAGKEAQIKALFVVPVGSELQVYPPAEAMDIPRLHQIITIVIK